jgi:hypothetical protein
METEEWPLPPEGGYKWIHSDAYIRFKKAQAALKYAIEEAERYNAHAQSIVDAKAKDKTAEVAVSRSMPAVRWPPSLMDTLCVHGIQCCPYPSREVVWMSPLSIEYLANSSAAAVVANRARPWRRRTRRTGRWRSRPRRSSPRSSRRARRRRRSRLGRSGALCR